jgi:hypothetical protein
VYILRAFGCQGLSDYGKMVKMTISSKKTADWDALAFLGVPLMAQSNCQLKASGDLLVDEIKRACGELEINAATRKLEAIQGFLLAVHSHFPDFFRSRLSSPSVLKFLPSEITGRLVRLRRQALARICEYL